MYVSLVTVLFLAASFVAPAASICPGRVRYIPIYS